MDFSNKPQARRPRVVHGPHRINLSGVAMPVPELPVEDVSPTFLVGVTELAGEVIEVPIELVTLADQTQQK